MASVRTRAGYSFTGLSVEKSALVVEIGTRLTRCGFAAEPNPRHIFPSATVSGGKACSVCPAEGERRKDKEQREILIDFFFDIFCKKLLVKAQDRRVVIVEGLTAPHQLRNCIARVLFKHYQIASVMFAPAQLLCLLPLGLESALVVDCGHRETVALGIFGNNPVIQSWTDTPLAGAALHSAVGDLVLQGKAIRAGTEVDAREVLEALPEGAAEDIAVRACFAGQPPAGVTASTLHYPLSEEVSLVLDHELRTKACDVLFTDDGEEEESVASAVLRCLQKCPIDVRRTLASNVLLVGGTSLLPGFTHRVQQEIAQLAASERFRDLAGVATTRQVTTLQLEQVDGAPVSEEELALHASAIRTKVEEKIVGSLVVACEVRLDGEQVLVDVTTARALDTMALVGAVIAVGSSYSVTAADSREENYQSGVLDCIAFHQPRFPASHIAWLGGAIIGSLESLVESSVSREDFLKVGKLPDWTRLDQEEVASVPAPKTAPVRTQFTHQNHQRPGAWGLGTIAPNDTAPQLVPSS